MKTGNIDISNLTSSDWLQIEMASKGCVSGTLEEWPKLRRIFNDLGLDSRGDMRSGDVRDICANIMNKNKMEETSANLDIELNVLCPHCSHYFDLFFYNNRELDEDGY